MLQTDKRFFYCTLTEDLNNIFVHNESQCPKCEAIRIVQS